MYPIVSVSLTVFALCSAAAGQAFSPEAAFEVASIRTSESGGSGYFRPAPDGFTAGNTTVKLLIETAYAIQDYQIKGGPAWLGTEEYDFAAKAGRTISPAELSAMLQNLLSDRFRLMIHKEAHKLDGYALVVAKGGPKLRDPTGTRAAVTRTNTNTDTKVDAHHLGFPSVIGMIQGVVGRPVVDKTGLAGAFDFTLQWRRETAQGGDTNDKLAEAPSIFTAVQEQLGLKLEPLSGAGDLYVIDYADRPSAN
jgi:uncharacterized protein (TIGR03435 family)